MPRKAVTLGNTFPSYKITPIDQLAPYARNPRTHSDAQVAQIAASIAEFGFTNPLLVDGSGGIIAGHGRLLAARTLGLTSLPTIVLDGLTAAQKRALVIADNKLALNASWDIGLLADELGELRDVGFDLGLTGFSETELDQYFAPALDVAGEWQGMPEFDQQAKEAFQSVVMHFRDQAAVDAFARLIGQPLTPQTRFAWFPQVEKATSAAKRYADAAAVSDLHSV